MSVHRAFPEPRLCATCGLRLDYSGRGRPPVAHPGSCTRDHRTRTDEARRWARYEEALRDAAVRAPFPDAATVETDHADDGTGFLSRLGDAGFAPLYDDPDEDVPIYERAATAHRDAVLANLSSKDNPNEVGPATDALVRCLDCPALAILDGARGVFTSASLRNVASIAEDHRLRRHLAEDDVAAVMARRPE